MLQTFLKSSLSFILSSGSDYYILWQVALSPIKNVLGFSLNSYVQNCSICPKKVKKVAKREAFPRLQQISCCPRGGVQNTLSVQRLQPRHYSPSSARADPAMQILTAQQSVFLILFLRLTFFYFLFLNIFSFSRQYLQKYCLSWIITAR